MKKRMVMQKVPQPVKVSELELGEPLEAIDGRHPAGGCYEHLKLLARLHSQPLGVIDLDLSGEKILPQDYLPLVWAELGDAINEHLRRDGLEEVNGLSAGGLPPINAPLRCEQDRAAVLDHAPRVSVIVPTRDRADMLRNSLKTLLKQDYPNFEIIVVDNAPKSSATADLVQKEFAGDDRIIYLREDRPGVSWARNRGVKHARGEIVAFTDDDAIVDRLWLVEIVRAFNGEANIGAVTGLVLPAELETPAQLFFEQFAGFNKGKGYHNTVYHQNDRAKYGPLYPYLPAKFGSGVNMAFRAEVIRKMGAFDPVFVNGQDCELMYRVVMSGYTLVYEPAALIWHYHRRDVMGMEKQLYGYGTALTAFLLKSILTRPIRLLDLLSRIPYAAAYLMNPRSERNQHRALGYPRRLLFAEIGGMLLGPVVYFQHKKEMNRVINKFGPLEL